MSLERQVRIGAGSLVLLGVLLGWLVHPAFFGLSAFVGAGLVFAGVTDWCGMGLLLAKMPWNRSRLRRGHVLALALIFGAAVGFSLGLTGGGGSIIAVPLLVYGLAMAPREAVGVSLAAVGATALVGAVHRLWHGEVEVRTGLIFAVAGMLGAPVGTYIGRRVPETVLLLAFAALMLWVAAMMWRKASTTSRGSGRRAGTGRETTGRRRRTRLPPRPGRAAADDLPVRQGHGRSPGSPPACSRACSASAAGSSSCPRWCCSAAWASTGPWRRACS